MGKKASKNFKQLNKTVVPPTALNPRQNQLIKAIDHKEMIVTLGPAGTGKSYISAAYAAYYYNLGKCKKIVITRPTVPTGKSIGYFPGSLEDKMLPWIKPFLEVIEEFLSKGEVECMIKNGKIEIVPFETIRGRSWQDTFIILDEAQNCTFLEIKAFITRHGDNSKTIINGDVSQSDLNGHGNGLDTILKMLNNNDKLKQHVEVVEFTSDDVVRSGLCKLWVEAFSLNSH